MSMIDSIAFLFYYDAARRYSDETCLIF